MKNFGYKFSKLLSMVLHAELSGEINALAENRKALSQKTVDIQGFFATRLRVILSEDPPRSHFGYASCFWDNPKSSTNSR